MEARELEGRVSLVTGASRGIGRAVAVRLAALGSSVAVNYHSSREAAEALAREIEERGGEVMLAGADVRQEPQVKAMVDGVVARWGHLDILVNNAGIVRNEMLLRLSTQDWEAVIDTCLKGAYLCCKYALRHMLETGWGRIINTSSVAALRGNYGQTNYSAAKGGLISLTRSLAREVGSHGITVNAIAPGLINTDMMQTVPEGYQKEVMSRLAIKRVGEPEDVAELVAFLASERAGYITAQVIAVDGGLI